MRHMCSGLSQRPSGKACPNDAREIEKEGYMALVGSKSGSEIVEATNMGMMDEGELVDFVNGVMKVYEKIC
ncbi:hypothetical protein [Methanohalobium sp.]|uniref:hypothetical protein n=1 Tax=Methanohalobium sp. TaxID=2837493 RepID=UPI0025CDC645|nr:hypothetical protein [Methanohalobium sp.]